MDRPAQRPQRKFEGVAPPVAERERAELDDMLARGLLPARARAFQSDVEEALAGGLDVSAPDRKPETARIRVIEAAVVVVQMYPLHGPRLVVGRAPMQLGGHDQLGGVGNTG